MSKNKLMEIEETINILKIARVSLTVPDKTDTERCDLALEWVEMVMRELQEKLKGN